MEGTFFVVCGVYSPQSEAVRCGTGEENNPLAPAIRAIDRSVEFLDLVTACHAFVAAAGRVVPGLRDRQFGDDERVLVHENVARVRATLDWIETAVDTGKVDVDGELARLLQGE